MLLAPSEHEAEGSPSSSKTREIMLRGYDLAILYDLNGIKRVIGRDI